MDTQNEMMDYIWLLNSADNSSFELKELYAEFLRRKDDFGVMRQSIPGGTAQSDYLQQELRRYLKNLADLHKTAGEVIGILRLAETGCSSNEE